MALFQKGESGNKKGRKRGSGKLQIERGKILSREIVEQRFSLALQELDQWHQKRLALILDYATLQGEYILQLDQDHEIHRRNRDKIANKNKQTSLDR
jgi:hypothetical protein